MESFTKEIFSLQKTGEDLDIPDNVKFTYFLYTRVFKKKNYKTHMYQVLFSPV